jgi:hypothetical protein
MVKMFVMTMCVWMVFSTHGWGEEVLITSEVEVGSTIYEHQPVRGTVTVTHPSSMQVDVSTFKLGNDPLNVDLLKEVKIAENQSLLLSIYRFQLPGKTKGLYVLPEVSVKVGSEIFHSIASSYAVEAASQSAPTPTAGQQAAPAQAPSLKIEAYLIGDNKLYPGQHLKVAYKYAFTGDIALDKETLPLLDAAGFVKIGEKEIVDGAEGDVSTRIINQEIEAVKPGTYTFGPSLVEGYAYTVGAGGQKAVLPGKLTSEAPALTITVLPFPAQDKPSSFNGAVGEFSFSSKLLSPKEMNVGEEISLQLTVQGKGNLKNVILPDLCCQPGFSGFFRTSDLPPEESIADDAKTSVVKLRPMSDQIKAIPSIAFAFFNPTAGQYQVVNTDPIPISIKPETPPPLSGEAPAPLKSVPGKEESEPVPSAHPALIEIGGIMPLEQRDLENLPFGTWWVIALIPAGAALLLFQWQLKRYNDWLVRQPRVRSSTDVFNEALRRKGGDIEKVKAAFKLALFEAGLIDSADIADADLPDEGIGGEVKKMLATLDEKRYSGKKEAAPDEIVKMARPLFNKVQQARRQP